MFFCKNTNSQLTVNGQSGLQDLKMSYPKLLAPRSQNGNATRSRLGVSNQSIDV